MPEVDLIRISDLPTAESIDGLATYGVDGEGTSVKVPVEALKGNKGAKGDQGEPGEVSASELTAAIESVTGDSDKTIEQLDTGKTDKTTTAVMRTDINRLASYNQYNYATSIAGKTINSATGVIIDHATRSISAPIKVYGTTTLHYASIHQNTTICCYGINNNYLGYVDIVTALKADTSYIILVFPGGIPQIGVYFETETVVYPYGKTKYQLDNDVLVSGKVNISDNEYDRFLAIDKLSVRSTIFNPNDYQIGALVNGNFVTGGGYTGIVTGFIPIKKITYYTNLSGYYIGTLCFYDKKKVYLSDIPSSDYITSGIFKDGKLIIADERIAYIRIVFPAVAHLKQCRVCEIKYISSNGVDYLRMPRKENTRLLGEVEIWGDSEAARPYEQWLKEKLGISNSWHHSYGGMTTGAIRQKFLSQAVKDCPQIFMGGTNDGSNVDMFLENTRWMADSLNHTNYIVISRFIGSYNSLDPTSTPPSVSVPLAEKIDKRMGALFGSRYLNVRTAIIGMGYNFHQAKLINSFVQPALNGTVTVQLSQGAVDRVCYWKLHPGNGAFYSQNIMIGFNNVYDRYEVVTANGVNDTIELKLIEANYKQPSETVDNIHYVDKLDAGGGKHTYDDYLQVFSEGDKYAIDNGLFPSTLYYDTVHLNDYGGEIVGKLMADRLTGIIN